MTTLTIDTEDKKVLKAVKAMLKAFEIPFEEAKESPYDPEYVAMIKRREQQAKDGNTVTLEEGSSVWSLINTK